MAYSYPNPSACDASWAGSPAYASPAALACDATWAALDGPVIARHVAPARIAGIPVAARHVAPCGQLVPARSRHLAPAELSRYWVTASHRAPALLRWSVAGHHLAPAAALGLSRARHAMAWGPLAVVSARHLALSGALTVASARHLARSGPLAAVPSRHLALSGSLTVASARHAGDARITAAVGARHRSLSTLLASNRAAARHRAVASLPDPQVDLVPLTVELWAAGRRMPLAGSLELTADQGSSLWSATFYLDQAEDYARLRPGEALTLRLGALEVALVCDGLHFARGEPPTYRVQALSPLARLGAPWAVPVLVGQSGMARALCERLLGQPIDWRLPDWPLPASVAAMEGTPLELVQRLCAVPGGMIESRLDGALVARPASPVSVPEFATALAARLTDRQLFGHSASLDSREILDRYTITSGQGAETAIQVETDADAEDPHAYWVRAYPVPWRALELVHTGDAATAISPPEAILTDHDELIELVAGAGTLRYPLARLGSSAWQYVDLGAFTQPDPKSIAAGGAEAYSLLSIQYQARAWQWRVTNARTETIQFLVVE